MLVFVGVIGAPIQHKTRVKFGSQFW